MRRGAAGLAIGLAWSLSSLPLVPVLARVEQNGVKVDVALLKRINDEHGHPARLRGCRSDRVPARRRPPDAANNDV